MCRRDSGGKAVADGGGPAASSAPTTADPTIAAMTAAAEEDWWTHPPSSEDEARAFVGACPAKLREKAQEETASWVRGAPVAGGRPSPAGRGP